jgi:predicted GIY-YIG superfamily endonuclease
LAPSPTLSRHSVYVLKPEKDQRLYIGMTSDVGRLVKEHAAGKVPSTRNRRLLIPLYSESYTSRIDAAKREGFLKSGPGHRFLAPVVSRTTSVPPLRCPDVTHLRWGVLNWQMRTDKSVGVNWTQNPVRPVLQDPAHAG